MLIDTFSNRLSYALQFRNFKASDIVNQSELLYKDKKINKSLSKPLLSRYLKGIYEAKQDNLYTLSLILNVSETWLMGYDVPLERKTENRKKDNSSKSKSVIVPILGNIPAGIPIEAIVDIVDYEEISETMLAGNKEYFGLKIKGDSMSPIYLENDILIVLKQDDCENGQDSIVMVNGNDATFKRVYKNDNGITLQPLNNMYPPQFYSNSDVKKLPLTILGVVKEVRRKI